MAMRRIVALALFLAILIPLTLGALSGLVTFATIPTWYQGLVKPAWNPLDWLFAPESISIHFPNNSGKL